MLKKSSASEPSLPATLLEPPGAPPDHLYTLLRNASHGYKSFLALRTALELHLFEQLVDPLEIGELAVALKLDRRVLEPFCAFLVELGLLVERNGKLHASDEARDYLSGQGDAEQHAVVENLGETFQLWERLSQALTQGPLNPEQEKLFGGAFLPSLAAEALVGEVQRTVALVAGVPGFSEVRDLLDLGGGHGLYAQAFCARYPELDAEILDLENTRDMAERHISLFGARRVHFVAGNIFTSPLGHDRDAVLLLYSPGGKQAGLLKRIHDCLKPGGFFVTKHAFYARDEGSKSPLVDLEWNLTAFPGVNKLENVYRFKGDLCQEEYMKLLEEHFELLADHGFEDFAAPDLCKFGDRLDSRLIVARKR